MQSYLFHKYMQRFILFYQTESNNSPSKSTCVLFKEGKESGLLSLSDR